VRILRRASRRALAAGILLALLGSAAALVQPLVAREVLEAVGEDRSLTRPLVLLACLLVGGAIARLAQGVVLERAGERMVRDLRTGLAERLVRLPVGEVERRSLGDLLSRFGADTTLLQAVTGLLVGAASALVTLVGALALMAYVDVALLGVVAATLVGVALISLAAVGHVRRASERAQAAVGATVAALERSLGALRTVKASGAEEREAQRIAEGANEAYRQGVRSAWAKGVVGVVADVGLQAAFLAVLGLGGARVATGDLAPGDLVAFLLYLFLLFEPVAVLGMAAAQLQDGIAAQNRLEELERLPTEAERADHPAPVGRPARSATPGGGGALVAFEDVTFAYPTGPPVLRGLSFTVPAGGQTALVGPSGAGKTTVLALLQRFHEAQGGAVRLAGRDVRTIPHDELRRRIGFVGQEAPVLAGTLEENVRYGAPGATDAEVEEALRATNLAGLVARLPEGLQTEVGDRGVRLSGGERQRVAIARALLRRPELLLLDEATSQLDAVNEALLRETIARAAERCTVVVVAHRLSTVLAARSIVVLEAGRARAVGTHDELVTADALYRELAAGQLLAPAA
jgi:ATP-binding cassette subfamily B protein/ATP-binding cassette subfamily C protein